MTLPNRLNNVVEDIFPEWRDKFFSLKDLKEQLKLIYQKEKEIMDRTNGRDEAEVTKEVIDFVRLLEDQMQTFNEFFSEKEEEYVIRLKKLQDSAAKAKKSIEGLMKIRTEMVDFHEEIVLLEYYSTFNYTELVKILEKYNQPSVSLRCFPLFQKVLQQPFFSTDMLHKLVKECETLLDHIFSQDEPSSAAEATNEQM